MKKQLFLIVPFMAATLCASHSNAQNVSPAYDSALAKKLGADEYGMKEYVVLILNAGPTQVTNMSEKGRIISAHLRNMDELSKNGKIAFAGPFMQDNEMQEIFIMEVKTIDEAKEITENDPGVKAGMYSAEYHLWYGPAVLQEIGAMNKSVQKKKLS